jgi:hypothetical protein
MIGKEGGMIGGKSERSDEVDVRDGRGKGTSVAPERLRGPTTRCLDLLEARLDDLFRLLRYRLNPIPDHLVHRDVASDSALSLVREDNKVGVLPGDEAVSLTSDRDADAVGLFCREDGLDAESSRRIDSSREDEGREDGDVVGFVGGVGSGGRGGEVEEGDRSDEGSESRHFGSMFKRRSRA